MSPVPKRQDAETVSKCVDPSYNQLCEDLRVIKDSLLGNEKYGHKGLFVRVEKVERVLWLLILLSVAMTGERLIHFLA